MTLVEWREQPRSRPASLDEEITDRIVRLVPRKDIQ
jgi:hypothetical protein